MMVNVCWWTNYRGKIGCWLIIINEQYRRSPLRSSETSSVSSWAVPKVTHGHHGASSSRCSSASMFATLDRESSHAAWIGFQAIAAGGTGIVFTATLPSMLAPLPQADVSVATRASVVFNGQFDVHLGAVSDPAVWVMLEDWAAYGHAASSGAAENGLGRCLSGIRGRFLVFMWRR
ncbi:hypothetical protein B0H66DRAFT_298723 [Apodospora peruviana]|uniref:Uncharacterized protein n=1 Tax=Apodospora peruviana TaxID=516989 RepID=A0AAE0M2C3_9PEZI|nr:hypothetical protein B0H66DRAFT_298723 [Apodospora peruviana]